MQRATGNDDNDDAASELSYLQDGEADPDDSDTGSVTGALLEAADEWHDAQQTFESPIRQPETSLFKPDYRIAAGSPLYRDAAHIGQRPSPIAVKSGFREERTPTARHFALDAPVSQAEVSPRTLVHPYTTTTRGAQSARRYFGEEASPTLPSPWDNPSYSQPVSPSLYSSPASPSHNDRWRPRLPDSRPSMSRLPYTAAAITKRGSITSSHRKNPSFRLSGSGYGTDALRPMSAYSETPLWQQQQQVESVSLSRSNSSRSRRGRGSSQSQSSSRRASRNFDLEQAFSGPDSANSVESSTQTSALVAALAKLEMMQSSRKSGADTMDVPELTAAISTSTSSSASRAKQARRFSDMPFAPDNHTDGPNAPSISQAAGSASTSHNHIASNTRTVADLGASPTASMHVSSTTVPSFADTAPAASHSALDPISHASTQVPLGLPCSDTPVSPSKPESPSVVPDGRRASLTRPLRTGAGGLLRKSSSRSGKPTLNSGIGLSGGSPWEGATVRSVEDFLSDLHDSRRNTQVPEPLVLDVRPLHLFLGDAGRIRGSINVNFPSLLVKRFRKGNTTSFSLASFITTELGKARFKLLCPNGDLSTVSIYVLDEHILPQDFDQLATCGSIGAVLIDILERQKQSAPEADSRSRTHYLSSAMSQLLDTARSDWPALYSSGAEETEIVSARGPTAALASQPVEEPEAPTPTAASSRLAHSRSEASLTEQALPKRKLRGVPYLTLPTMRSSPAIAKLSAAAQAPPPSPGLFRSYSEPDAHASQEPLDSQTSVSQRNKPPPIALGRLDTSEHVRRLSAENEPPSPAPFRDAAALTPSNGSFANRTSGKQSKGRPPNLAPPRSFQEIAMAQASTPTAASFARAANARLVHHVASSEDFESEPPKTPLVRSHHRNISTDSTASSNSSQYPSFNTTGDLPRPSQRVEAAATHAKVDNAAVALFDVSVIIPGFLYLGPEPTRESDVQQLQSVGIKRILNMAVECDTFGRWNGRFEKIATIPMRDSLAEIGVQDRIREACVLLDDADLMSKPTYVHCKAGKSRSVTIVLAYLVHRNHWPLKRAYAHVSERRKGISPNIGFVAELMRFEEAELGARSQGVLGSGNTPVNEQGGRNGYFRTHSRNGSLHSSGSMTPSGHPSPGVRTPSTARSESGLPTALDGRPTIVRHLSLIASTAMNLSADQAGSKAAKDAQTEARNARVRESLPPGVGFSGMMGDEHRPHHTRSRSRTGIESAPPVYIADL